jgi:hypothetical protein
VLVVVTLLGSVMMLYVLGSLIGKPIPASNLSKTWAIVLIILALILAMGVFVSSGGRAFFPGFVLPGVVIPDVPSFIVPSLGLTTGHLAVLLMVGGLALVAVYLNTASEGK